MREMKKRIVLAIEENEMNALEALAKMEIRAAWQQAALIIRKELEKQGLMETVKSAPTVAIEIIIHHSAFSGNGKIKGGKSNAPN
jgi:hypothetical protein